MGIKRTLVQTANGKYVMVDTANIPEPLRIGMPYEIMVFKSNKKGELKESAHPLDIRFAGDVQCALFEHESLVEKWKEQIVT